MARMLGEPEARGLTLVADYQTRGAGRKGRPWIAPPGSALLFTTALPERLRTDRVWIVPFWIGLAIRGALADFEIATELQWPNDVLLQGRKVAGILCISRVLANDAWVACGVGLNVLRPSDAAQLDGIAPPPAFVSDVRDVDRDALLQAILRHADTSYDDLRSPDAIARAWEPAAHIPGARYRLLLDGEPEPLDATAVALAQGGELVVETGGEQRSIALADARVLR